LGVERRFFEPYYYFTLQAGLGVSYYDRPVLSTAGDETFTLDKFTDFGPYFFFGIHKKFYEKYLAGISIGGLYQNGGSTYRVAQIAQFEIKRSLGDALSLGFWLQEELGATWENTSDLQGTGHSMTFWPMAFLELKF
jgi:hypothetical protein